MTFSKTLTKMAIVPLAAMTVVVDMPVAVEAGQCAGQKGKIGGGSNMTLEARRLFNRHMEAVRRDAKKLTGSPLFQGTHYYDDWKADVKAWISNQHNNRFPAYKFAPFMIKIKTDHQLYLQRIESKNADKFNDETFNIYETLSDFWRQGKISLDDFSKSEDKFWELMDDTFLYPTVHFGAVVVPSIQQPSTELHQRRRRPRGDQNVQKLNDLMQQANEAQMRLKVQNLRGGHGHTQSNHDDEYEYEYEEEESDSDDFNNY